MVTKVGLYRCKVGTQIKWRVRWFGRHEPKTGKEKRYSKTFDRKVDAEQFRSRIQEEFNGGLRRDPSSETLKAYADRWLEYRVGFGGIKPATAESYQETFTRLYEFFGPERQLRTITQREVREFLSSLKRKRGNMDKELSNWAKHRCLRECSCLFGQAVRDGIIPVNHFQYSEAPKLPETEWYYLPPAEFHKLLAVTPALREKALYALCYTAGLRRNEALTLYWSNIDFDKGMVKVTNRDATEQYPPFHIKDHEKRTIPLPKFTVDMLTELYGQAEDDVPFVLLDQQRANNIQAKWRQRQQQGQPWRNADWANNTLRGFKQRVRRAGIETWTLTLTVHDLRKCCGQNWADVLPMNVVKELMGHSNIQTTAKFYNQVTAEHRRVAQQRGQELLTRAMTDHKMTISANTRE